MKHLLIIGARGYGREMYHLATQCKGYGKEWDIRGYLDDKYDALEGFAGYPPIIDAVENYVASESDVFCCALGSVIYKEKYINLIVSKGGSFINLIHPTVLINPNTKLGKGLILCAYSFISNDVTIGDYVTIQNHCTLGHDVEIGDYCQINAYSFFGGWCKVHKSVTVNASATIIDRRTIGENATIGAGSVVIRNVKPGLTLFGNPAREI